MTYGLLLAVFVQCLSPAAYAQAPVAPTGLVATPGDRQVILTWNDPANSAITRYQYRVWDGRWFGWADMVPSDASTTSFTWTASANGTEYRLQIRAFAGSSASPASNTARATPRAATVLLNNIGGVFSGTTGSDEYATPFTTGTHPYGYTISEVVIFLSSNANASNPALVATIRERGSGNRPGDLVATLINPSTLMTARNTFTTPPGTALSPNTTYYLVFNDGNAGTQPVRTARFVRPGDKQGGAADWNLPDNGSGDPVRSLRKQTSPSNPWGSIPSRLLFSISGNPIDYAPTVVDNPAPLHDGPCIPWTYGTPRGYCSAKQTAGASDNNVGSDLPLPGNPAAFIETESGEKDVHGRTILEIRETSCGTNTGSFRIRTLNWRFPGPPAVADPKVWVVATTGERWVSHGPGNDRFRSAAPRMIAGGAKLRLDGEYGLPVPVAPHDGEGVVEVNFTVESDTNDSFEFQLLASRDANQKYNMLGWTGGGITGNSRRRVLAEDAAWGPTVHVEFIKNRNLSCPDAMSGSNSPPEAQSSQPPVVIGHGQPADDGDNGNDNAVPEGAPNPHADLIAQVHGYAAETQNGQEHVDRWLRVLAAFGDDNGHTPMTAAEAQTYADKGWSRWEPVAAALTKVEAAQAADPEPDPQPEPQPQPEPEPPACVSDDLRASVSGYSLESHEGQAHVDRWLQVLAAFGIDNGESPMAASEAQTYADKGWTRWDPVVEALKCLEARAASTPTRVPLVPGASNPVRQGMVRFSNQSPQAGQVQITAIDDAGRRSVPLMLDMEAGESVSLTSRDLERGNRMKGLGGAAGPGTGDWRLEVSSELEMEVRAYAHGVGGAMNDLDAVAPVVDGIHQVPLFNPADGIGATSALRLVNRGGEALRAWIAGTDDAGFSPGAGVSVDIPAGASMRLNAADLEAGAHGLRGALGDGQGHWRLRVASTGDLAVMSLLEGADGALANLSGAASAELASGTHAVSMFPSASNASGSQGFVRIVNDSPRNGTVRIVPYDGDGQARAPLTMNLGAGGAANLEALDLELGNAAKGLRGSAGPGAGDWRLEVSSDLDIDVLPFVVAPTGVIEIAQPDRR